MRPAPFAPGTYGIGGTTGPDGTLRTVDASFQPFGRNCSEGGQQEATGGTVTYTTVTDTLVEASYDLLFGRSRVRAASRPDVRALRPTPDEADVRQVGALSADGQTPDRPGAPTERLGGAGRVSGRVRLRTRSSGYGRNGLPVGLGPVVGPVADGRPGGPAVAVAGLEVDAAVAARHAGLVGGVQERPPLEDHVLGRDARLVAASARTARCPP